MIVGEESIRIDAPVVVEDSAATDNRQIGLANGLKHSPRVAPENSVGSVARGSPVRCSRGDRELKV